jgi:uncharacterized 2Fe-2S/4Fe-4S cluster protein (DUF4445 family)
MPTNTFSLQKYLIAWRPSGQRIEVTGQSSLLEAAQLAGVGLSSLCGGIGACDSCRIRLVSGYLTAPSLEEIGLFSPAEVENGSRLACQAFPRSDVVLEIPSESLTALQRLQIESQIEWILSEKITISNLWNATLSGIDPSLGLAVDLGSTKIAAYLLDMSTGITLAWDGAMNPQIAYGEDIISRIHYINTHSDGLHKLQRVVVNKINELIDRLLAQNNIKGKIAEPTHVVDAVVVGNTAMHHIFTGLPVEQLGVAPYQPVISDAMVISAADLGLHLHPEASIYLPPNIAGYVGGDHVAMLLATRLWENGLPAIALDIGTNTEISLIYHHQLFSCSCASGPAFEGAHIQAGMRAAPGAIERVQINHQTLRWQTIDNQPPIGICGSGILDAVAQMRLAGILNHRGAILPGHPSVRADRQPAELLLAHASQTAHHQEILVTRKDVNEIQLAKAAIRTGIEILLFEAGINADDLDQFIIAGAFGTYIHIPSAVQIGMFPALPLDRFRQVGNAAGSGARQMLLSLDKRLQAQAIIPRIHYVELSTHPKFQHIFTRSIMLDDLET